MTTVSRYDAIANFYASATGDSASDPAARSLLKMFEDVAGLTVLDVACGHGRISRELARRGARVTGIDISSNLLALARSAEQDDPLGVTYENVDIAAPDALDGRTFDAVACNYGMSDVDDFDAALAAVARVLRPAGVFVFSILHPCFPGWDEDAPSAWPPESGYYTEGWWIAENSGFRGKVGSNFRMLSSYFNALTAHGLVINRVDEPPPPTGWGDRLPGAVPVPFALVVRCLRG